MEGKPMAPNCYLEVKGPEGSAAVARRQACYDGAIGARGMLSLHSYGKETMIYDNRAYTISSTYYDQMYATHFTPPTDAEKPPEYQMTYLGAWALTGSREQFQHGAAAFRNGRDWAKERRDEFISIATTKKGSSSLESTRYSRPSEFGKSASLGILKLLLTSLPFRQL